jgi:hypothetical protein
MTSPMDEALRRTSEAVERYAVPQKMIAIAAESLERMPKDLRREVEVDAMANAITELAGQHNGPHPDCLTCIGLGDALAVAMGSVRAEADLALTRMLGDS